MFINVLRTFKRSIVKRAGVQIDYNVNNCVCISVKLHEIVIKSICDITMRLFFYLQQMNEHTVYRVRRGVFSWLPYAQCRI